MDRPCRNMQLYLPTCTCRNMHPQLYIPTCTHTSGCIKGPLFSLPVVSVIWFKIRIRESLTWRSGLFGPAGEFASEVERLQQSIRCEMSMSIDDGSRNDHVPEIATPKGEEPEPTLAEIVRAMNGQQDRSPAQFMSECQRESHAPAKAFVSHTAAILGGRYKQPKVKENGHASLGRPIRHRYGAV